MSPGLQVVVVFLVCWVAMTALLLGLSVFLQGFLYNEPANRLPLRALTAGLLLAIVSVGWAYVNTRASHADKYGTFFEFNPTAVREITSFEAVRLLTLKDESGQPVTVTVPFTLQGRTFVEVETGKPFARSSSNYVTTALLIRLDLEAPRKFVGPELENFRYKGLTNASDAVVFQDESSRAFVSDVDLRKVEIPSPGAFTVALLLNAGFLLAWWLAAWPLLQFRLGHALLLSIILGGVSLFVLMPLLFYQLSIS